MQKLVPEYAKAASILKQHDSTIVISKVGAVFLPGNVIRLRGWQTKDGVSIVVW